MPRVQMAALAMREAGETPVVVGVQDEGDRLGGGLPGGADGNERYRDIFPGRNTSLSLWLDDPADAAPINGPQRTIGSLIVLDDLDKLVARHRRFHEGRGCIPERTDIAGIGGRQDANGGIEEVQRIGDRSGRRRCGGRRR